MIAAPPSPQGLRRTLPMPRAFCLLWAALSLAGCVTPVMRNADTMTPERMLSGSVMDKETCTAADTVWDAGGTVWVDLDPDWDPEDGTCIRYVLAGLDTTNPIAVVYFHGDTMWQSLDGRSGWFDSYPTVSLETLRGFAQRETGTLGLPYIRISRPGTYGSSGFHKQRRRAEEAAIVDAALDQVKQRHAIDRLALVGQSGGGHVVASLLTRRDDIGCAVITSGVVAVARRARHHGWDRDITGYRDFFDPIEHVADIVPDPTRRIFVVGDPRDRNTPFFTQEAYAEAVRAAGHAVDLIRAEGEGRSHHGLSATGFKVAKWCVEGVPSPEIQERLPIPPEG
jgi:dienelactone hydrolase